MHGLCDEITASLYYLCLFSLSALFWGYFHFLGYFKTCTVQAWASFSHRCASVTKQYKLVLA